VIDYRQSEQYSQYFSKKGWVVEKIGTTLVLIKKLPWIGSIIKIQRGAADTSLVEVEKMARENKALFTVIEPDIKTENPRYTQLEQTFKLNGYKDLSFFLSPTKTAYIDLSKSEENILSSFDKDIRKSLRRNLKKAISFRLSSNLEEFYSLLYEAGTRRNFSVQAFSDWKDQWGSFGSQAQIILSFLDGELLGGNMFLINPPAAFGLFLPTTENGRSIQIAATLIWEGLKLAKKKGCVSFDLDGLYDDRYKSPKKWRGVTTFKRKFNGHEVEFMRSKVKIYAWYLKPLGWLGLL